MNIRRSDGLSVTCFAFEVEGGRTGRFEPPRTRLAFSTEDEARSFASEHHLRIVDEREDAPPPDRPAFSATSRTLAEQWRSIVQRSARLRPRSARTAGSDGALTSRPG